MVLPYVASKFAVVGMTHSLAAEPAPHDITGAAFDVDGGWEMH